MNIEILTGSIGIIGVVVGGVIAAIPLLIQESKNHKRWLIEKKIRYLEDQIQEIDNSKKLIIKDFQNLFIGGKFIENDNLLYSVPIEVIKIFKKCLKNYLDVTVSGDVPIDKLSKFEKEELLMDISASFEVKKQELKKEIKNLLS